MDAEQGVHSGKHDDFSWHTRPALRCSMRHSWAPFTQRVEGNRLEILGSELSVPSQVVDEPSNHDLVPHVDLVDVAYRDCGKASCARVSERLQPPRRGCGWLRTDCLKVALYLCLNGSVVGLDTRMAIRSMETADMWRRAHVRQDDEWRERTSQATPTRAQERGTHQGSCSCKICTL